LRRALTHGEARPEHLLRPRTLWPDLSAGPMLDEIGEFDAVVDVSGFAYGDAWGTGPILSLAPLARRAAEQGAPTIFMPQSWGAFSAPVVRRAVLETVGAAGSVVYSRDAQSTAHLIAAGMPAGSVRESRDIVFAFEGADAARGEELLRSMGRREGRPLVGIAPSMRVLESARGAEGAATYVRTLAKLARHCVDTLGADVVVLPFECPPTDTGSDDRPLCAQVRSEFGRGEGCLYDPSYLTAPDAWALVGACDAFVSSRYHAAVFALSQGVPCTLIGWSHKYEELLREFEDDPTRGVETAHTGPEDAIARFDAEWLERDERRIHILARSAQLRADAARVFDEVAQTLTEARNARR
jgi:colanic acid/amylovoran biosynthesis protein